MLLGPACSVDVHEGVQMLHNKKREEVNSEQQVHLLLQ